MDHAHDAAGFIIGPIRHDIAERKDGGDGENETLFELNMHVHGLDGSESPCQVPTWDPRSTPGTTARMGRQAARRP